MLSKEDPAAMKQPLVSIIVTTYNNHATLEACLRSIKSQSYENTELIIVDNHSTDDTLEIAQRYTRHVYTKGPERCTQRNYAVKKSSGVYVVIIDSDMELSPDVVTACVDKAESNPAIKGIIIPEESFGEGFWAQCKKLERSFYVGIDWIEAARFFDKQIFQQVGGYDETLVSGEDWDLSQRVGRIGKLSRVTTFIRHNEGHINLFKTLKKKSYYAQKFTTYTAKKIPEGRTDTVQTRPATASEPQSLQPDHPPATRNPYVIVLKRFGLFLSQPLKLFKNPLLGLGVLFMKICEFGFGAVGYLKARGKTE